MLLNERRIILKKSLKIMIIIENILFVLLTFFFGFKYFNEVKINTINKNENRSKYYEDIENKMQQYYKMFYRDLVIPENNLYSSITVTLGHLKTYGFPVDDFVNYDTKEKCDEKLSYAVRFVKNNKQEIKVYYKCGDKNNYKTTE